MNESTSRRLLRQDLDVVLDRDEAGCIYAGVPRSVWHYGVDTFDWGYVGPASAELALNVLNWIVPPRADGEAPIRCERGECSALAWRLHRSFMAEVLLRVPYAGGCVKQVQIVGWVRGHGETPDPGASR